MDNEIKKTTTTTKNPKQNYGKLPNLEIWFQFCLLKIMIV